MIVIPRRTILWTVNYPTSIGFEIFHLNAHASPQSLTVDLTATHYNSGDQYIIQAAPQQPNGTTYVSPLLFHEIIETPTAALTNFDLKTAYNLWFGNLQAGKVIPVRVYIMTALGEITPPSLPQYTTVL